MKINFIDMTGRVFGRLTVLEYVGSMNRHTRWNCQCECGVRKDIASTALREGKTLSCGCLRRDNVRRSNTVHGEAAVGSITPEYRAYRSSRTRCNNPNNARYASYGGRGIEFRFQSFQEFLTELGRKPFPQYSLDRIDVNGHYEKGNVRWASSRLQYRNQRRTRFLTLHGERLCLADWADKTHIAANTIRVRLNRGWSVDAALTTPAHSYRTK